MSNETDVEVIRNTQKILAKYVKKPPLTDKLLGKPPFRFLHDLVIGIIRDTGFLKGLYTEREMVSENVREKDDKLAFLNKLITAIKSITGKDLSVRASKIAAGLESTETNLLLQTIGYALDNKLDSTQYVNQLKNKSQKTNKQHNNKTLKSEKNEKKNKTEKDASTVNEKLALKKNLSNTSVKSKNSKDSKNASSRSSQESIKKNKIKAKITPKSNSNRENELKESPNKKNLEVVTELPQHTTAPQPTEENKPMEELHINERQVLAENDTVSQDIIQEKIIIIDEPEVPNQNVPKRDRIKSAKQNTTVEISETSENNRLKSSKPKDIAFKSEITSSSVIHPTNSDEIEKLPVRPRSSLRPPSARPSSARPGAPRIRSEIFIPEGEVVQMGKVNVILENLTKEQDEEETVTIQSIPELDVQSSAILTLPSDKGHLVEQILEQIQQDDNLIEQVRHSVDIEWEQDGLRSRNTATKEIEQLKNAIQTLTKTANPLGKLINYLHEDIEAMHNELEMWTNLARQIMVDVANQKRLSDESNKPFQVQLQQIEENIVKHQQQINTIYGNILRNETRIHDLLVK